MKMKNEGEKTDQNSLKGDYEPMYERGFSRCLLDALHVTDANFQVLSHILLFYKQ